MDPQLPDSLEPESSVEPEKPRIELATGIRPVTPDDYDEVADFLADHWGSQEIVSLDKVHDAAALEGFVAPSTIGDLSGLLTFHLDARGMEIVTMNSIHRGRGIGTKLMNAVEAHARAEGASRLWLVTSNDNLDAMVFYQRRGFRMVRIHTGAVDEARTRKPSIPEIGEHGIPMRDLVEFEKLLPDAAP